MTTTYEIIEKLEANIGVNITWTANKHFLLIENLQSKKIVALDKAEVKKLLKELYEINKDLQP